jgi:hypothetical protein
MTRDNLQQDASRPGFPVYGKEQLPKVNAMRAAKSQPDFHGIPILHDQNVTFTSADSMENRPASCFNCALMNTDKTCMLMSAEIVVDTVTIEGIEYWPRCADFVPGGGNGGQALHLTLQSPDQLGLVWINAPKPGQEFGGSNCGGCDGGDDCDHYMVKAGEKWDNPQGECRVLQHTVNCGDYCAAWWDDDILQWQEAQNQLANSASETGKRKLAKDIIGKDDA